MTKIIDFVTKIDNIANAMSEGTDVEFCDAENWVLHNLDCFAETKDFAAVVTAEEVKKCTKKS